MQRFVGLEMSSSYNPTCPTSAGFLHVGKLIWKLEDIRIVILTQLSQEVQQCHLLICGLGVSKLEEEEKLLVPTCPRSPQANSSLSHWAHGGQEPSVLSSCSNPPAHLTEEADVKAKSPRIPGASIHIVANKQGQLQKAGEVLALSQLLTRGRHRNDLWLDIFHLLTELQPKEDGIEARPQAGHSAHLGGREAITANMD